MLQPIPNEDCAEMIEIDGSSKRKKWRSHDKANKANDNKEIVSFQNNQNDSCLI